MAKKIIPFKPILVDKQNRKSLSEGRNYGVGFSLAKKDGNTFVNAYATSCCRDFLGEEVASEFQDKKWSIYGLHSEKKNLFDLKLNQAYLVFGVLPYSSGGEYSKQKEHTKLLSDNLDSLQKFINYFEGKFKIKQKSKFHRFDVDNRYLGIIDLFWAQPYRISLITWLMRVGIYYDGKQDAMEYLEDIKYSDEDKLFWTSIKPKLIQMINGFIPEQEMSKTSPCPHNYGIIGFSFKAGDLYKEVAKKEGVINPKPVSKLQPMAF